MKSKAIKAFIRRSIKAQNAPPDAAALQPLLDQMSMAELQQFWMHFAADRAYSATLSVPHWKTKEQEVRLQAEHVSWIFYPKEKDASGKYVVVRADLEEHIRTHLLQHIEQERQSERTYRMRPAFDRLHARLGMAVVLLAYAGMALAVCFFVAGGVFHASILTALAGPAVFLFVLPYCLYLLMPAIRPLLRKTKACKSGS
jgi:hypothetical protein